MMAYSSLQLMLIGPPEACLGELTLTPMSLKVAAKAHTTGISEKLTFYTGEPVGPVQKADPIPCRQVVQPSINVPMKLLVQLDSVVKVPSYHGGFSHVIEEGSARPTNVAHEVRFGYQSQNGPFGCRLMACNVLK